MSEGSEDLFALSSLVEEGEVIRELKRIRPLTEEERVATRAADALFNRMTEGSGLAALRKAESEFAAALKNLQEQPRQVEIRSAAHRVQKEFKAWLSAFRAFDDRTSAWLSRTFARREALAAFKSLLSVEYDSNFAYRLCATLRNASEHVDDVISRLTVNRRRAHDGAVIGTTILQFDGPRLAGEFAKLKASVKAELRRVENPLEVTSVMQAVMTSCERVHCGLLRELWDDIEPVINLSNRLHQEAVASGGQWAAFIDVTAMNSSGGQMQLRYNPLGLVELLVRNRREADDVLARPLPSVSASDLTVPSVSLPVVPT